MKTTEIPILETRDLDWVFEHKQGQVLSRYALFRKGEKIWQTPYMQEPHAAERYRQTLAELLAYLTCMGIVGKDELDENKQELLDEFMKDAIARRRAWHVDGLERLLAEDEDT